MIMSPLRMLSAVPLTLIAIYLIGVAKGQGPYSADWSSIDSRPLPPWYDEAKIGVFVHWGVFSVPSFETEWFWWRWKGQPWKTVVDFMEKNYRPKFTYADFAAQFTAELFNPSEWSEIFNASGARYVVFVSKHHEGFTNWPSDVSWNWNSMDVGPQRDIVGELATAIRAETNLRFGLYHSLFEWFNPLYKKDAASNFTTNAFVRTKTMPELYELVNRYQPEIIWSDGCLGPDTYWNSTHFLAWLYNDSPVKDVVVTNDRWGTNITCHHGGFLTCKDRYNPGTVQKRKFETCLSIDRKAWGYRREAKLQDFLTMDEVIDTLAETVSCGGNLLINVGPTHDGRITPVFEERLRQLGAWLQVNGEAIYSSRPWKFQNDTKAPRVWYTSKPGKAGSILKRVYAIVLDWPQTATLTLAKPISVPTTQVTLLGYPKALTFHPYMEGGLTIDLPVLTVSTNPSQFAWAFKMTDIAN